MELDEPGWPLIDDFFEDLAQGRKPVTVRRYVRVRQRLYDFLDVDDMCRWLEPDEVTLLAAEREFGRDGAVRSALGLGGLLRCLSGFVGEDVLPSTTAEARMQISVVNRFVIHLRDHHLVPRAERRSLLIAGRAVRRARLDLIARDRPSLRAAIEQIDAHHNQQPRSQR
jgi:hypothetical protein